MKPQDEFWGDLARAAFAEEEAQRAYLRLTQPKPQYSERYKQRMAQLLQGAEPAEQPLKARPSRRWLRPAVAAALVLALVLGLGVAALGENRWNLLHVRRTPQAIIITNPGNPQPPSESVQLPDGWPYLYLPTWLPEGYQEQERLPTSSFVSCVYADPADSTAPIIVFDQYREIDDMGLDNEDVIITKVEINGDSGALFEKYDEDGVVWDRMVVWSNEELLFIVHSALPADDLLHIAASLQKFF